MPANQLIINLDNVSPTRAHQICNQLHHLDVRFSLGTRWLTSISVAAAIPIIKPEESSGSLLEMQLLMAKIHDRLIWDCRFFDTAAAILASVLALRELNPWAFTMNGSTTFAGLVSAVQGRGKSHVFGVTIPDDMDQGEALSFHGLGAQRYVLALAKRIMNAGGTGILCDAQEISILQHKDTRDLIKVATNVMPTWLDHVTFQQTPAGAIAAGANYLLLEAGVIDHPNPLERTTQIMKELGLR